MAIVTGKGAKVKYTSATYSTAAAEGFTSISPTTLRADYRITDATKRHWARETSTGGPKPPLMLVGAVPHTTDFSVNYVQGKVTFDPALTTAESATVTGTVYWHAASFLPWTRSFTADINNGVRLWAVCPVRPSRWAVSLTHPPQRHRCGSTGSTPTPTSSSSCIWRRRTSSRAGHGSSPITGRLMSSRYRPKT